MSEAYDWLLTRKQEERARLVDKLSQKERNDFEYLWDYAARP